MRYGKTENDHGFKTLNEIFEAACDLPTGDQAEFLRLRCGTDAGLLSEAERLLSASKRVRSSSFLEGDAFAVGTKVFAKADRDAGIPDEKVGSYNVVSEIGRGGMGVVYLAARNDFQRLAAIKVIKRGMDTDEILSRFRQERDVLASLDHPNIARLLDGGTTESGQPYLVMEFVDGTPIKDHCDANGLGLNDRLALFLKVCSAVSYAHKHLTVHRDLKPSNILVTADGEPKLLDFGIAKILSEDADGSDLTSPSERLFTPEYASPEQFLGERITTSSDVYGLGVLLYELLTGHRPFETSGRDNAHIAELVCSTDPPAPSRWLEHGSTGGEATKWRTSRTSGYGRPMSSLLKGDLDNIILTALRKDAERRYSSVDEFAGDIRRYLDGMPVNAHPATWGYKARKFVSRNRAATAAAAIAIVSVIGGTSLAAWKAVEADRERAAAERRFDAVRQLANSLVSDFNDADPATAAKLRDISAVYLETLANESNDPELLLELGNANLKLAHSTAYFLIDENKAAASLANAEVIARKLIAADQNSIGAKSLLLNVLSKKNEFWGNRDPEAAISNDSERIAIFEELMAIGPDKTEYLRGMGLAVRQSGTLLAKLGRDDEARTFFERADVLLTKLVQESETAEARLWAVQAQVANMRDGLREPARAAELIRTSAAAASANDVTRNAQVSLGAELTQSYFDTGAFSESIDAGRELINIADATDPEYLSAFLVRNRYDTLILIAHGQLRSGRREDAIAAAKEAIAIRERWAAQKSNTGNQQLMSHGFFYSSVARFFADVGERQLAENAFMKAERAYLDVLAAAPRQHDATLHLADLYFQIGSLYAGETVCTTAFGGLTAMRALCSEKEAATRGSASSVSQALAYYKKALDAHDLISTGSVVTPRDQFFESLIRSRISGITPN